MANNLQRRLKKLFSEESQKIVDVVDNFKNKTNIIYDFGESTKKSVTKKKTDPKFQKIIFNKHNLGAILFADKSNEFHKNFNKIKFDLLDDISKNQTNHKLGTLTYLYFVRG